MKCVKPNYMLDKGVVMYGHTGKLVIFWLSDDNSDPGTSEKFPEPAFKFIFCLGKTETDC